MFFCFCLNICTHFNNLRESFDGDKKKFVESHQIILDLTENLNNYFMPVIFIQFVISSVLLCVIGFQVVVAESFVKQIISAIFGMGIIIQLYIYCYGGQIIKENGSSVADKLYHLDKDLVIVIARAQRAQKIKSLFYEANLSTFKTMLSAAASLITLLKSFI